MCWHKSCSTVHTTSFREFLFKTPIPPPRLNGRFNCLTKPGSISNLLFDDEPFLAGFRKIETSAQIGLVDNRQFVANWSRVLQHHFYIWRCAHSDGIYVTSTVTVIY